jgi:hypothetical protein
MVRNMAYRPFIGRIVVALLVLCIAGNCSAQKKSKLADMINWILSDTLKAEFYLIPVNVRFKGSDRVWIDYENALTLYQACENKYGWSRSMFIDTMESILLYDKILDVDSNFFSVKNCIPRSECNSLYNETPTRLRERVLYENHYKYPDNRFSCFVYKCFMNYVPLGIAETRILYVKEQAWQGNE